MVQTVELAANHVLRFIRDPQRMKPLPMIWSTSRERLNGASEFVVLPWLMDTISWYHGDVCVSRLSQSIESQCFYHRPDCVMA